LFINIYAISRGAAVKLPLFSATKGAKIMVYKNRCSFSDVVWKKYRIEMENAVSNYITDNFKTA